MGGAVGDGGSLLDAAGNPVKPSGRLQVFEPKDFPFLHTGHSLVFVIARNGMVWGKRLDEQSARGDLELEVFWPVGEGCLVRMICSDWMTEHKRVSELQNDMTESQKDKIQSILSQKETIQYELGTLMVRPVDYTRLSRYQRTEAECKLTFPQGEPCNIQVIDCSNGDYDWSSSPNLSTWNFYYDDAEADFKFFGTIHQNGNRVAIGSQENPVGCAGIQNVESSFDSGAEKVIKRFFVSKLSGRMFDMSGVKLHGNVKINPSLRIMYGEYDFFEYFGFDDAALVLEEETVSADFPKLYWTLGVAQNKYVRGAMRLASNNPDLFAPSFPESKRIGGIIDTP